MDVPTSATRRSVFPGLAHVVLAITAAFLIASFPSKATAQCATQWVPTDGVSGGAAPTIFAMTMWDADGAGPLEPLQVVAGEFTMAGTTPANNVAVWNGSTWSALGTGLNGGVNALAVLQNGNLVAAGTFATAGTTTVNNIAQWNGTAWAPIGPGPIFGTDNTVNSMTVRPNGDLVIGGFFTHLGGAALTRIARWNGTSWSAMGSPNNIVWAVLALPNGDVVAGGQFTPGGGVTGGKAARWNGTAWSPMGTLNSNVLSLGFDANGNVIAGGQFTFSSVPVNRIARWNGTAWEPLGAGINGTVWAVQPLENGDLIVGGVFLQLGDGQWINSIAGWNGTSWYQLGTGLDLKPGGIAPFIGGLTRLPNGDVMVGGEFPGFGGGTASPNLARWASSGAPTVLQNPLSQSTCSIGTASFLAEGTGVGSLSYVWGVEFDPGVWTDILDGALIHGGVTLGLVSGAGTGSMQITSLTHFRDDRIALNVRCVISDNCGSAASNSATLSVGPTSNSGDANGDGLTNGMDISAFQDYLIGGAWTGNGICTCDFNGDGGVNTSDVTGFVERLLGA